MRDLWRGDGACVPTLSIRRPRVLLFPFISICFLVVIMTILYGHLDWGTVVRVPLMTVQSNHSISVHDSEAHVTSSGTRQPDPSLLQNASVYVKAIMDSADATFSRLVCLNPNRSRYDHLRGGEHDSNLKYFFALDLRQNRDVLPRLIGSIIETIVYLGVSDCEISIVEGNSNDGTFEVLYSLKSSLAELGVAYELQTSTIDPRQGERIEKLAQLRNMALASLLNPEPDLQIYASATSFARKRPDSNTTVIYLNDVALCMDDILELLHQRQVQEADMTCAMDWVYVGQDPTFYDVWVARTLLGDTFFHIPTDGSWDSAWNLFWNDHSARERFDKKLPFQVYACWNGAVTFGAGPLLNSDPVQGGRQNFDRNDHEAVRFRAPRDGECHGGEPTLFCKDLWWNGHGRIAVVPAVNLEYSDEKAKKIKDLKGYTSKWVDADDSRIEWQGEPPDLVKCMPGWEDQTWRPWNETLV